MSIEFYRGQKLTCAAEDYLDGPGHSGPKSAKNEKNVWTHDDYLTMTTSHMFSVFFSY